jgi:hypothetical protein
MMSIFPTLFAKRPPKRPYARTGLRLERLDRRDMPSVSLPIMIDWHGSALRVGATQESAVATSASCFAPAVGPFADIDFHPQPAATRSNTESMPLTTVVASYLMEPRDDVRSRGSETKPDSKTYPPGSTGADRNPKAGDDEDKRAADREKAVGDVLEKDYKIERQPNVVQDHKDKYPNGNPEPDLKVNGRYFDVYSPKPTTPPVNIADAVDKKVARQADRIVLDLQVGFTKDQIDGILRAIQDKRDTPDTATRTDLVEIWVLMPDGTMKRIFPGVIR